MNQKGFALLPLLVILILAGAAGYFVWQKKSQTSQIPSDWKTYRNEKYGFEVKYPKGYVVTGGETNNPTLIAQIQNPKSKLAYWFQFENNPDNLTPKAYISKLLKDEENPKWEGERTGYSYQAVINISGVEAWDTHFGGPGGFDGRMIFFSIKDKFLEFYYELGDSAHHNLISGDKVSVADWENYKKIGDQILSTFKFLK